MGANRIRSLRASRALSPSGLAARFEVDETTISRWESGESGIPDWRKEQLASFFGVSVPYMMGWRNGSGGDDGDDGERMAA